MALPREAQKYNNYNGMGAEFGEKSPFDPQELFEASPKPPDPEMRNAAALAGAHGVNRIGLDNLGEHYSEDSDRAIVRSLPDIGHAAAEAGVWSHTDALDLEFLSLPMPDRSDLAFLWEAGVSARTLSAHGTMTKAASVEALPGGRFEFTGSGDNYMFINAVRAFTGEILDMVAWSPSPLTKLRLMGRAFALGEAAIDMGATYFGSGALQVWRSPLDWLRAEGRGIVIVDRSGVYERLRDVPSIAGEDLEHGRQLQNALIPRRPRARVVVPSTSRKAA